MGKIWYITMLLQYNKNKLGMNKAAKNSQHYKKSENCNHTTSWTYIEHLQITLDKFNLILTKKTLNKHNPFKHNFVYRPTAWS